MTQLISYHLDTDNVAEYDKIISNGIQEFNRSFVGSRLMGYSIFANNAEGDIIGGARVFAYSTSVYVDVVWVDEVYRGHKIGETLLGKVEREASRRNIPEVTLDTFGFQAEGFYLKQGYERIGVIDNYLNGHERIFLRKSLNDNLKENT